MRVFRETCKSQTGWVQSEEEAIESVQIVDHDS